MWVVDPSKIFDGKRGASGNLQIVLIKTHLIIITQGIFPYHRGTWGILVNLISREEGPKTFITVSHEIYRIQHAYFYHVKYEKCLWGGGGVKNGWRRDGEGLEWSF